MILVLALRAVHAYPRHALLFAGTTGLLLGPLSRPATIGAALAAATAALAAAIAGGSPGTMRAQSSTADPTAKPDPAPTAHSSTARSSAARLDGRRVAVPVLVGGAVLAGALVADLRLEHLEGGRLASMHGSSVAGRAVVLEPFRERAAGPAVARARLIGAAGDRAAAAGDRAGAAGDRGSIRGEVAVLRIRPEVHPGGWPGVGEIVDVVGRVSPLGRYDAYQRRRGAGAAIDVSRLRATGMRRGGAAGIVDAVRRRAEAGLSEQLPPQRAALLRGMVLGQDERLEEDTRDDFKRSGLAHILAVSGQNVMLLATLVLAAGAVAGVGLRARLLLAIALVALYVPLTGAGPSIQRAGVMGAAGLVAALAGRASERWYALGFAAAVTLAMNPLAAGEPGWQLSFAAVVALLALAPRLSAALARRMPAPVADVAAITTSATIGTAPLMALHFEQVSLVALPANLLAAAAIAPIMWLGMLAAAAAQFAPALAAPLNLANAPLLAFVDWVAHTMATPRFAVLRLGLGSPPALAVAYVVLAAAIVAGRAIARRTVAQWRSAGLEAAGAIGRGTAAGWRSTGPVTGGPPWDPGATSARAPEWRRPSPRGLVAAVAAAAAVLVLLIAAASTGGGAPPAPGELVVSFLDVGQGDATLLQRDGATVLVDTGPPDGPIVRRLADAGVERLDALVLTHAQADHEGAALAVMRTYPPRLVVNGGAGWPSGVQEALPEAVAAAGARVLDAYAGQVLRFGSIRMRLLWPPRPGPGFRPEGDPNDRAIVAHVKSEDFDLLLPADAESNVTARLDLPQVEALKVAHHGSADDGLPALLERLDPELAAIEVGRGNTYGHPTPSTLAALRTVPQVYRTDRDGTIRLRVRGDEMRVERSGWFR